MELKISLLQVPRIWVDGKELSFPLRRADALLFYMVCNRTATREELVSLLWDQVDVETGRRNLRNILYVMKKTLGIDLLISVQKNKLSLNPAVKIDCDYQKFMEQGDYMAMHGPFLNGFGVKDSCAFDEWVDNTRDRVKQQYLACLTKQVKSTAGAGAVGRAERCALEYLQENLADETMACFLISLYRSQSRFFDGVQIYQRLHDYLSAEMGISPLSETTKLYQAVLKEWNLAAGEQEELSPQDYFPPSRRKLLGHLNSILFPPSRRVRGGGSLLLRAAAGMGKTFLVTRYLESLGEEIFWVRNVSFRSEQNSPYSLWRVVTARLNEALITEKAVLPADVQELADRLTFEQEPDLTSDQAEKVISTLLDALLVSRRVLLCLEDIQWVDVPSIQLLGRVLRRFSQKPLSCLLTGRDILPDDITRIVNQAVQDRILSIYTMYGFSQEEVREFLQSNFDSKIALAAAQPVFEGTKGNPALLIQLCQRCDPEKGSLEILQQRLSQMTQDRIKLLSDTGRRLLGVLSFFPEGTSRNHLFQLLDVPAREGNFTCDELLGADFLIEIERGEKGAELVFADKALCTQFYQQYDLARRQEIHQKIARVLEAGLEQDRDLKQIAYHYEQGEDWLSAVRIKGTQWERTLKEFCGKTASEFQTELCQVMTEAARHISIARALPEEECGKASRWLLLAQALAALFFHREGEAVSGLLFLFSNDKEGEASLIHVSLRLISRWAWENGRAQPLVEQIDMLAYPPIFFHLLKGELLSLLGCYSQCEDELYSLMDNQDHLICAYACHGVGLNRQRQNAQDAAGWLHKSVSHIAHVPAFWGIAQLYQDAGREMNSAGEGRLAQSFFETALYLASQTGDQRALTVAQAHLSVLMAVSGHEGAGIRLLLKAETAAKDLPAFEQGTVCLVKAQLSRWLEMRQDSADAWKEILPESATLYSRRGLMLFYPLQDVEPERFALQECLRFSHDCVM